MLDLVEYQIYYENGGYLHFDKTAIDGRIAYAYVQRMKKEFPFRKYFIEGIVPSELPCYELLKAVKGAK